MATLTLGDDRKKRYPVHRPPVETARHHLAHSFRSEAADLESVRRLLVAAVGGIRPGSWGRAAPCAAHWREVAVLVLAAQGVWRYDPRRGELQPLTRQDVRHLAVPHDGQAGAPVQILYVTGQDELQRSHSEEHGVTPTSGAGCIAESVHRLCAAQGLACALGAAPGDARLARTLRLHPTERVVLVQSVGHPAAGFN